MKPKNSIVKQTIITGYWTTTGNVGISPSLLDTRINISTFVTIDFEAELKL